MTQVECQQQNIIYIEIDTFNAFYCEFERAIDSFKYEPNGRIVV